jgi:hypothetical protein
MPLAWHFTSFDDGLLCDADVYCEFCDDDCAEIFDNKRVFMSDNALAQFDSFGHGPLAMHLLSHVTEVCAYMQKAESTSAVLALLFAANGSVAAAPPLPWANEDPQSHDETDSSLSTRASARTGSVFAAPMLAAVFAATLLVFIAALAARHRWQRRHYEPLLSTSNILGCDGAEDEEDELLKEITI